MLTVCRLSVYLDYLVHDELCRPFLASLPSSGLALPSDFGEIFFSTRSNRVSFLRPLVRRLVGRGRIVGFVGGGLANAIQGKKGREGGML